MSVRSANPSSAVRRLQERAARALPANVVERLDGWWLRYANISAWWISSVLPHSETLPPDLAGRLRTVEEFYAGHGIPTRYQISPGACPVGLDEALAERGYDVESPMSLQVASTEDVVARLPVTGSVVRVDDQPTDAWFGTWLSVHGAGDDPGPERELRRRVGLPSGYASVLSAGAVIATGRAVADTGWVGVFGMATLPEARGRGAASQALAALARWAAARGASRMYLQVERENTAAQRLYRRAGFTELCRYHYRVRRDRPVPGAGQR